MPNIGEEVLTMFGHVVKKENTMQMQIGRLYQTANGKTVETVRYHERLESWLCLWDDLMACWYNEDGKCQMWDADKEPDKYHIDFSRGYDT